MMSDDTSKIISELTECDISIMTIIGRIGGSQNKNFTRQTVKKKASNREQPHVDDSLDSLRKKGLIHYYRKPDNFAVSSLGFKVAIRLKEKFMEETYPDLRFLMLF